MRGDVCTYVCMYSIRSPRGPKAQRSVQLRTAAMELCLDMYVVEQDQMGQATKFQTLIVVCKCKYRCDTSHSGKPWQVVEIHFSPVESDLSLPDVDLH